jgi:hypothetical protein
MGFLGKRWENMFVLQHDSYLSAKGEYHGTAIY